MSRAKVKNLAWLRGFRIQQKAQQCYESRGSIDIAPASGDLQEAMNIVERHSICQYYSAQLPAEMRLS